MGMKHKTPMIAALLLALSGCATVEQVNRVDAKADQALQKADEALRTAQEALRTANEAKVQAAQARQENRQRTERMFEKAMQK